MEIGKFKLAKADLVRPPNKPAQEQIIPKQKPYTEKVFKLEVDDFIKGFIGGFPKDEMLLKIQSVLDKAVDAGAIEPQEGIKYLRERKQQLVDFARENYGQELPGIEEDRKEFSLGTEEPITANNDFSNIQVADLKDDLTPFNASLEESTTGPGGYPMTASLITQIPTTAKKAIDLFEAGKVGIRDATKITKDFFNRTEPYGGAERIGTATKKDREKDKDFLKVFNKLKNKFFQGNVTRTNKELGLGERFTKDLEQRIFKSEKGTRKISNEDRFLFYEPSVPEPTKGMSYTETTSLMKKDPDKFLSLKVDKDNPNKFLDKQSLSNYLGIKFEKDKTGKLTQLGKTQFDALSLQLKNLGVKKTNQGLFDVNDAINKLVKKSESKLIKGERKSDMGAGRYNLEKKFDPELFQVRNLARDRVLKRSKGLDVYLPNAVDNAGHPYSLSKSEEKYKKLFKNSNINKINTLVYQDPLINKELFKTSGYESKYDKMFDKLSKIQNKKITPEIQEQLLKIKNDLNQNYNYVKDIIKNPKELIKYLPEDTDPKFINYLSKTQGDRVQKIDIDIPKVGETFKSENIFVDMSSVDPKYILGYINNINPNAKKFKDLSLAEQKIYKDNLLLQNSKIVSDFYKKSGYTGEEVEEVREAITMPFAAGGRASFEKGTPPKQPLFNKGAASQIAKIALANPVGVLGTTYLLGGSDVFDPRTSEGRVTLGAEAAFAPSLVRGSQEIVRQMSPEKRRVVQKLLNLGASPLKAIKYARALSPIGIATLLGEGIYQGGKYMLERKKMLESLTDEQRDDLLRKEKQEAVKQNLRGDPEAFEGIMAADGGLISRQGFADGPEDPSKRKFMKIAGGLASLPIIGRFFDVATTAPKVAETVKRTAEGIPDFLTDLIAKVKLKAEATGMKYFTGNRSDEFADVYQADNFVVTEKGNKIILREVDDPDRPGYRENEIELEVDPETGGVTYKEASVRPDDEGKLKDVEEFIDEEDLENMRKYTYDE